MEKITIGKLAKQAEVGIETLRFYEREGLIEKPERAPSSGYRLYSFSAVKRVRFIRRAKDLGFTLKEIQQLMDLRANPNACAKEVKAQAQAKIEDIEERIASLRNMKNALSRLTQKCCGAGLVDSCPILEELDGDAFFAPAKENV